MVIIREWMVGICRWRYIVHTKKAIPSEKEWHFSSPLIILVGQVSQKQGNSSLTSQSQAKPHTVSQAAFLISLSFRSFSFFFFFHKKKRKEKKPEQSICLYYILLVSSTCHLHSKLTYIQTFKHRHTSIQI